MTPSRSRSRSGGTPEPEVAPPRRADLNLTERTYLGLVERIERGSLRPGEVLEERRLARRLGVSRTPLRAALSRLHGEGILTRLSNGLPAVSSLGSADFLELVHLRRVLESEAAALAAGRVARPRLEALRQRLGRIIRAAKSSKEQHWALDDEIHDLIAGACGSRTLAAAISDVRRRARMCNVERVPARLVPACREHLRIVDALAASDAARSRRAMTDHLDAVRDGFLQSISLLGTDG